MPAPQPREDQVGASSTTNDRNVKNLQCFQACQLGFVFCTFTAHLDRGLGR